MAPNIEIAVFGGGCFWCTEAVFNSLEGVRAVVPGYSGGTVQNPTYEQVSAGKTGHAEAVKVEYDSILISYRDLLVIFFNTHDPTTVNRQGMDVGPQYRSVIFYANDEQRKESERFIKELDDSKAYDNPVVTEVVKFKAFYPAEDYHQKFYESHKDAPYCQLIIEPKIEKIQKRYRELLKK